MEVQLLENELNFLRFEIEQKIQGNIKIKWNTNTANYLELSSLIEKTTGRKCVASFLRNLFTSKIDRLKKVRESTIDPIYLFLFKKTRREKIQIDLLSLLDSKNVPQLSKLEIQKKNYQQAISLFNNEYIPIEKFIDALLFFHNFNSDEK